MTTEARLESLCELIADCPHSTPKWTTSGVTVLRSQNIRNGHLDLSDQSFTDEKTYQQRSRRAELKSGDIVITREAPMGEVCMIPDGLRCCLGQRMVLLRPDLERVHGRFLLYALQSAPVQNQISWSEGSGSTVSNLRIPHLKALRIPTFERHEQSAIAGVLGALDDKIEQNRGTARALERLAQAIFRAWFVDFEPVKAKAEGATSFPSVPQPVFDALPTRFVDSDIGPVPEGWVVKPIGDVVRLKGGGTPSTMNEEYWNGGVHCWATPKDMSRLSYPVLLNTERHITDAGVDCISSGLLPVGTVLMSSRAPVGYLAIAGVPTAINQGFIAMVCDGPLPPVFVLNWAVNSMDTIKAHASGTTFPEISKSNFRPLPIIQPSADAVTAYQRTADSLFTLLTASIRENERLAEIRDYLLPLLLSGSLKVSHD